MIQYPALSQPSPSACSLPEGDCMEEWTHCNQGSMGFNAYKFYSHTSLFLFSILWHLQPIQLPIPKLKIELFFFLLQPWFFLLVRMYLTIRFKKVPTASGSHLQSIFLPSLPVCLFSLSRPSLPPYFLKVYTSPVVVLHISVPLYFLSVSLVFCHCLRKVFEFLKWSCKMEAEKQATIVLTECLVMWVCTSVWQRSRVSGGIRACIHTSLFKNMLNTCCLAWLTPASLQLIWNKMNHSSFSVLPECAVITPTKVLSNILLGCFFITVKSWICLVAINTWN